MTKKQIEKKAKEIVSRFVPNEDDDEFLPPFYAQKAAICMADWALSHQWVSVKDELPPPMSKCDPISDRVFVHTSFDCVFVDHYDHYYDEWLTAKKDNNNVTHWMPIPPLAEEGGKK